MTKTTRRILTLLSLTALLGLGGCGITTVQHSTTESRYMTQAEQEFWTDKRGRQDKAAEWAWELDRQSNARFARALGI